MKIFKPNILELGIHPNEAWMTLRIDDNKALWDMSKGTWTLSVSHINDIIKIFNNALDAIKINQELKEMEAQLNDKRAYKII